MIEPDEFRPAEPVELPIDGVLDLHTFRPPDVKEAVLSYLEAERAGGVSARCA